MSSEPEVRKILALINDRIREMTGRPSQARHSLLMLVLYDVERVVPERREQRTRGQLEIGGRRSPGSTKRCRRDRMAGGDHWDHQAEGRHQIHQAADLQALYQTAAGYPRWSC